MSAIVLAVSMLCLRMGDVPAASRTAQSPDSWLVLYNLNVPDSVVWAQWYRSQRRIPPPNLLGLNASPDEHLPDAAAAEAQIIGPVRAFLAAEAEVSARVMGIVLGYGLPGHYGTPPYGVGGYSIACALQNPANLSFAVNPGCSHTFGDVLPPGGRLTKATLTPGHFMVARIDAPSLENAKALTTRAKAAWLSRSVMPGQWICYDYSDSIMPNGEWFWLKMAVLSPNLRGLSWRSYDEDTEQTPQDAFRFGTHDTKNWDNHRLRGAPAGPRILAYDLNSWGATTVRSTTAEGGRFVPNAIDAGYAAAIGSTGEPSTTTAPYPDTLLEALLAGWTLGEAFYLSNPYDGFMWTLVGDPFLRVPDWSPPPVTVEQDFDRDGDIDLLDFTAFFACVRGPGQICPEGCERKDLDGDGDVDLVDFSRFSSCYNGPNGAPAAGCQD